MIYMRMRFVALGILIIFSGLILVGLSRVVVQPPPTEEKTVVDYYREPPTATNVLLEGNLTKGDNFKIYYSIATPQVMIPTDTGLILNVTDPQGNWKRYAIELIYESGVWRTLGVEVQHPGQDWETSDDQSLLDVANYTGLYTVKADTWGVYLSYLALQKIKIKEEDPLYPNSQLLPVGLATLFGGAGLSFFGAKTSARKRIRKSHHLGHKTKLLSMGWSYAF